jgi:LysM repeat protein
MIFKALTILLLVAAVLGGSAYFVYDLYYKDKKLDLIEQTAPPTPVPSPTPDPSVAAWDALKPTAAKDTIEARESVKAFITAYPESVCIPEATAALGRMNLVLFRDTAATPANTVYTVKKGDSLAKIASVTKNNVEQIHWANQLSSINLQIGQQLLIPSLNTSAILNREKSTLIVFNHGEFFKEYPIVSLTLTGGASKGEFETKVADRVARKGETRVAFGAKDYAETVRFVLLSPGSVSIHPAPTPAADGTIPPNPSGIVLNLADFNDIFALLKTGTPVTIK